MKTDLIKVRATVSVGTETFEFKDARHVERTRWSPKMDAQELESFAIMLIAEIIPAAVVDSVESCVNVSAMERADKREAAVSRMADEAFAK